MRELVASKLIMDDMLNIACSMAPCGPNKKQATFKMLDITVVK